METIRYPRRMDLVNNKGEYRFTLLETAPGVGKVIRTEDKMFKVGYFGQNWGSRDPNDPHWIPSKAYVSLSNIYKDV